MSKNTEDILKFLKAKRDAISTLEQQKKALTAEIDAQIKQNEIEAYEAAKTTTIQVQASDIIEEIAKIANIPSNWVQVDTIVNITFPSCKKSLDDVFRTVEKAGRPIIIKFIVTNKFDNSNITNFKTSLSLDDKQADGKPLKKQFHIVHNFENMLNNRRLALTDYRNIICNFNLGELLYEGDPAQPRNIAGKAILNSHQAKTEHINTQD